MKLFSIMFITSLLFLLNSYSLENKKYIMPSQAMFPSIEKGSQMTTSNERVKYKRGDIIVFTAFDNDTKKEITKAGRILGIPGESIQVHKQRVYISRPKFDIGYEKVKINGYKQLEESFQFCKGHEEIETYNNLKYSIMICMESNIAKDSAAIRALKLKSNEYYILGDNRGFSADSRTYGAINSKSIIAKVIE